MQITIINDSKDDNAKVRQEIRYAHLFPRTHISFIGIDSAFGDAATISAAGNLIDALDASEGNPGVIAVNVAPRGNIKTDGVNGSAFCYFWYKKTLIISTIKGYNLSLIKKFKLTDTVYVLDIPTVLEYIEKRGLITKELSNHVTNTQFRSFEFQPRVAKWLYDKIQISNTKVQIDKFPDIPTAVWHIDSFGNAKTTLTINDLKLKTKDLPIKVDTNLGTFNFYNRLKDVPRNETALYIGSSGIGQNRFIELATQHTPGSAAKKLNLKVGDEITIL